MATLTRDTALDALRTVQDPDLGKDLVTLGMIQDLEVDGDAVSVRVVLTTPACPLKAQIQADVERALTAAGAAKTSVTMDAQVRQAPGQGAGPQGGQRLPNVKTIVAVGSGKGGVGKSTVAANLAISLARTGAKVGLLDADIYGPSVPVMFGLRDARPQLSADQQRIIPIERYGLKIMSMGFMLEEDDAVVWRGPMLGKALQQFIEDVDWGELDYLFIDLPPGTGDVQLSLAQLLPVSGAVVVTTPQDVAFADVRRAIKMFEKTHTPVVGLVENMSHFTCTECGTDHHLFGDSRIETHAKRHELDVLGRLPLDSVTAVAADQGEPIAVAAPDSEPGQAYRALAEEVARKLAMMAHAKGDTSTRFSNFFKMGGS